MEISDEDFLDIKEEIVRLKNRVNKLEEKLKSRKRIRTCPCKEREKGNCNVYVSSLCPFDEAGIRKEDMEER